MASRRLCIGQTASLTRTITERHISLFAEASGDVNPLHMDGEFAKRARFGERIAHGLLTAGLISAVLGTELPGPGSIYLSQSLRFLRPVKIGDTITATVTVSGYDKEKHIVTLQTDCHNQDGVLVLSGEAALLLEEV